MIKLSNNSDITIYDDYIVRGVCDKQYLPDTSGKYVLAHLIINLVMSISCDEMFLY